MKYIKFQIKLTMLIYVSVWIIIMFTCWKFYNPFWWIFEIGSFEPIVRFSILLFLGFYYAISYQVYKEIETNKQLNHEQKNSN